MKKLILALATIPTLAMAEPAINVNCNGSNEPKQTCTMSIDKERIEQAVKPLEGQAQQVQSPAEAMQLMSNAMAVFAVILSQK